MYQFYIHFHFYTPLQSPAVAIAFQPFTGIGFVRLNETQDYALPVLV
jgi:hypothetical protein